MAIKSIIAKGIGFSPGTISLIPTHGFGSGALPSLPRYVSQASHHRISRINSRRFFAQAYTIDNDLGSGLEIDQNGKVALSSATTSVIGGVLKAASDADLTDNSGGSASGTIAAMTNIASLTDSSGGTTDDTVSAVTGSGDDTNINNNFAELTEELIAQRALNTVMINAIASIASDLNGLKGNLRTAGMLDS